MKIAGRLLCGLVLLAAPSLHAQNVKAQQKPKNNAEVQLGSSWTLDNSQAPLLKLSRSLRQHAARRLRVSWRFTIGQSGADTTVLYDRDSHLLKLYSKHDSGDSFEVRHYAFSPVSDESIHKLAERYKDNDAATGRYDELAFFQHLTEFGALKRDLRSGFVPSAKHSGTPKRTQVGPKFTRQQMNNWLDTFSTFLAGPGAQNDTNKPASLEDVVRLEETLGQQQRIRGFKFPPSYRDFLLRYDGGFVGWNGPPESEDDDEANDGAAYIDFLTVAEGSEPWLSLKITNSADSVFMNHKIETYFPFEPLVMFAKDEGGNFWAFDPRHKRADGEMPVRFCDHETGDIHAQAQDFPSFILALSTGQLRYRGLENPI